MVGTVEWGRGWSAIGGANRLGRVVGRGGAGGGSSESGADSMESLGPLVSAGSAGEEAGFDRKKNWSAGGLLERERPLKVCGRSLQPMREATERLAALLTFWIKESNAGPMYLETSEAGREGPEDCAF